jgi:TolB protein
VDTPLSDEGGIFATPTWSADGSRIFYAVRTDGLQLDGQTVGVDQFVSYSPAAPVRSLAQPAQQDLQRQLLVSVDLDSGERQELFPFAGGISFGLSPDDRHMAFVVTEAGASMANAGVLHILDVETGRVVMAEGNEVVAFFWSPTGERLLFAKLEREARSLFLRWYVWDGERSYALTRFLPTQTFVRDYLPFFDQFALSQRFWSPDGESFVFTGFMEAQSSRLPGVFVQSVAEGSEPVRIADGVFAAWSPR